MIVTKFWGIGWIPHWCDIHCDTRRKTKQKATDKVPALIASSPATRHAADADSKVTRYIVTMALWVIQNSSHICIDSKYHMPPDPISHVCFLTYKSISQKYLTDWPVQIFKIMFRRFLFSKIWSSAQDHAVLDLLLNLVGLFISKRPRWSIGNDLYHSCTSLEGASRGGQPLMMW